MNAEEVHKHGEKVLNDFGKTLWSPGNVTSTAIIKVPRGCCFSVSVRAVSASNDPTVTPTPVVEVQNANFVIDRIA